MIERTLPLQIIKIGGSLLTDTADRSVIGNVEQWLAQQSGSINVVIVGGGVIGCSIAYHLTKIGWQ